MSQINKIERPRSVAFVGTCGVPNNYGGFEAFLEQITPCLALKGFLVYVTCDISRYSNSEQLWRGVNRIFLNISANGFRSIFHDLIAFFKVFIKVDVIIFLGVSAGIFFPLFRMLCFLFGKKLIVNVDGIEWRRNKFSLLQRIYLYISNYMAEFFSHVVIVDSKSLLKYLNKSSLAKSVYIPYSGDWVLDYKCNQFNDIDFLSICRIEPENNCHLILNAFKCAGGGVFVFIGNWQASSYGRKLFNEFSGTPGLQMLDPIYDLTLINKYRNSTRCYLHGHSVGGTNPSLVEILFFNCTIIAYDCEFNRETASKSAYYFKDKLSLEVLMRQSLGNNLNFNRDFGEKFNTDSIVESYISLII